MGLLDDLEQESQRRKAGLDDAERERAEREQVYKTQLEPGMQALYTYLTKLTQNLAFLKPKTTVRYEVPGYGQIVAHPEHEYDLKISSQQSSKEITLNFGFTVDPDDCPTVEMHGASKVKALNAVFQKYRLAGLHDFKKDDSGEMVFATFKARGKMSLGVVISADAASAAAKMSFTNFDTLGTLSKVVPAAQFNEQLFDEIGRYIAREPSTLFREELPDDYRRQLQQKIQQEQMRRKWEQKLAAQQQEELERLKREKGGTPPAPVEGEGNSLLSKVKGLFRKI
jgi:hypothetical protein